MKQKNTIQVLNHYPKKGKMEKKNFVTLVMSVIGGMFFALGMCMCLLPEWGAFNQGVVLLLFLIPMCIGLKDSSK